MLKIRSPRDFWGGLVLMALALLALWATSGLAGMQGHLFGPGTAPRLFAGLLLAAGAAIAILGALIDGPPIERYAVRGPAYVIVAIVLFALMIRGLTVAVFGLHVGVPPLGLIPSTFFAFLVSIMGSSEMKWLEAVVAAAAMTLFCVGLFVYLLNLPFQLWPEF